MLEVLLIEDDKNIRTTLAMCLEGVGCRVTQAGDAEAALAALARRPRDVAFLDVRLGAANGLELMPSLLGQGLEVVVMTAYATVDGAVEALRRGAREYLPKPFSPQQIRALVEKILARRGVDDEPFETESPAMHALLETLDRAARHDVPILLLGEHGSGTSALARRVHQLSPRARQPFVVVHCPTLSEDRVEVPAGGTLFLDEIGELRPALQARLAHVLVEDRGQVRIVAASHRDLRVELDAGRFREDLLFRVNSFELTVPPLRERREDILPQARLSLALFARREHRSLELTAEAELALVGYAWPGNLNELRNSMEHAAIVAAGVQVGPECLPERIRGTPSSGPYVGGDFTLDDIEREHVLRVIDRHQRVDDAARVLGIDASTLRRKRKRYGT